MDEPEKEVKHDLTSEPPEELSPSGKSEEPTENDKDEEDFNFGGMPQRDLKKNLGCG